MFEALMSSALIIHKTGARAYSRASHISKTATFVANTLTLSVGMLARTSSVRVPP